MSFHSADGYRRFYQDASTELTVAAATGDTALITVRNASHTIYVQRIVGWISTDAAQSISFEDTADTPVQVAEITASPGDSTRWDFDYGDEGLPLTQGKNLNMNVSAAGLAGSIKVYAYQKLTAVVAATSA